MQELFEKARAFVYRNARPLDFARWRYLFEGGSSEDVLRALSAYQNADGGFGHGLEADALNPNSAPIQTWNATMILREIGLFDSKHPMVAGINRYLTGGMHFDGHCWDCAVPTNNDYPHAPWWAYSGPSDPSKRYYNPTASLAGWLLRTSEAGSDGCNLGRRIAQEAHEYYMSGSGENDMHLLSCFITLCRDVKAVMPELFDADEMLEKLRGNVHECLKSSAEEWGSCYCAMPSDMIEGRGDSLYRGIEELSERECAFIAETQQPDGAWVVPWRWGDYPDAFAVSANHWRSNIAIKNIRFLREMGKG